MATFKNPYTPGAGHQPPYMAGRDTERSEFERLLEQEVIFENLVLTGLRGTGKTVLLDTLKPLATRSGWLWVGTDLSEASSISEDKMATRLLTDLSVLTSSLVIGETAQRRIGFEGEIELERKTLSFSTLADIYARTPGLVVDKVKTVLEVVWHVLSVHEKKGLIFAYDEAQNLADHSQRDEFPLSLLLDTFQSLQRKNVPFMLVLTGLPTLFPKLVEARTFAERMFRVVQLDRLEKPDCRKAITVPIETAACPIRFSGESVSRIVEMSGGYPYFIQFICREVFDVFIQKIDAEEEPRVPVDEIERKMDTDFFAGRWARATDRQRELLWVIAHLPDSETEFTVQELVEKSRELLTKGFSPSHASQMLAALGESGLVYKNRHGRYCFAVPLLGRFIKRQEI